jgi:hypothetical protein
MRPDEEAALQLLMRELGAVDSLDEQAEFITHWNAAAYEEARRGAGAG